MLIGWRLLPERERYPLPPREIVGEVAERLGKDDERMESALTTTTILSHFGYWRPAMRILTPATRYPCRRNLLMILAHLVWGVTLGETVQRLRSENQEVD